MTQSYTEKIVMNTHKNISEIINDSNKDARYKITIKTHLYINTIAINNHKRKLRKQHHLQ